MPAVQRDVPELPGALQPLQAGPQRGPQREEAEGRRRKPPLPPAAGQNGEEEVVCDRVTGSAPARRRQHAGNELVDPEQHLLGRPFLRA